MSSTASATPIPHHERSSHHHHHNSSDQLLAPINTSTSTSTSTSQQLPSSSPSSNSFSPSPPLVSPLYAGANRVFAASTSPSTTQSRWSGTVSSSPSSNNSAANKPQSPKLEKEYFDGPWGKNGIKTDSNGNANGFINHHRRGTSGSISSSLSSSLGGGSSNGGVEPTTPRDSSSSFTSGMPLGRVISLPLSNNGTFEAAQKRLSGSSNGGGGGGVSTSNGGTTNGGGWGSLRKSTNGSPNEKSGMSGLLRSFSISRSNGPSSPPALASAPSQPISSPTFNPGPTTSSSASGLTALENSIPQQQQQLPVVGNRGRKASVGQGGKRRPSPMGERLLMGHFNAH